MTAFLNALSELGPACRALDCLGLTCPPAPHVNELTTVKSSDQKICSAGEQKGWVSKIHILLSQQHQLSGYLDVGLG